MGNDSSCPVCGRAVEPTQATTLYVCGDCSETLETAASGKVQRTGEFAAMSPENAADMLAGEEAPDPPATAAAGTACSWCGKLQSEVKKMLTSGQAHICNECVAFCADILTAELGDDWK